MVSIMMSVLVNLISWYRAILHDSEEYPEPERFNPVRFIKDGRLNRSVRDPSTLAFGFGRRCVYVYVDFSL